jgi:hypothetical protein
MACLRCWRAAPPSSRSARARARAALLRATVAQARDRRRAPSCGALSCWSTWPWLRRHARCRYALRSRLCLLPPLYASSRGQGQRGGAVRAQGESLVSVGAARRRHAADGGGMPVGGSLAPSAACRIRIDSSARRWRTTSSTSSSPKSRRRQGTAARTLTGRRQTHKKQEQREAEAAWKRSRRPARVASNTSASATTRACRCDAPAPDRQPLQAARARQRPAG